MYLQRENASLIFDIAVALELGQGQQCLYEPVHLNRKTTIKQQQQQQKNNNNKNQKYCTYPTESIIIIIIHTNIHTFSGDV